MTFFFSAQKSKNQSKRAKISILIWKLIIDLKINTYIMQINHLNSTLKAPFMLLKSDKWLVVIKIQARNWKICHLQNWNALALSSTRLGTFSALLGSAREISTRTHHYVYHSIKHHLGAFSIRLKPKPFKHLFSTSNFTSTLLSCFVLEHSNLKTKSY